MDGAKNGSRAFRLVSFFQMGFVFSMLCYDMFSVVKGE